MSENCKQKPEEVMKHIDRDNFMSPYTARDYGLIDKILEPAKVTNDKKEKTD